MKIAFLCNGYGKVHRGSENYTKEFYDHLKNDFDIDIYGMTETDHSIGLNTKFRDDFKLPWRNGRAYLESYYFGKKWFKTVENKYDLVFNNAGFPCSYWCSKFRKKTGTPFVTRARGGGREESLSRKFKPNLMIFLTKYHRDKVTKENTKTMIIPNAIDISKKSFSVPKKYKKIERPIFLSTSALVGFKRIHLIIEAVSLLEKGTLIQTSDGPLRDKIVKLGEKKLGDRFLYVGKVKRKEVLSLYDYSDVYVHSAIQDAFPNVYLEALSHSLPIVAQKNKRSQEILGESALFVDDCTDIENFAACLAQSVKKDWNDIPIKKAQEYSWEKIRKKYIEMVSSIVR